MNQNFLAINFIIVKMAPKELKRKKKGKGRPKKDKVDGADLSINKTDDLQKDTEDTVDQVPKVRNPITLYELGILLIHPISETEKIDQKTRWRELLTAQHSAEAIPEDHENNVDDLLDDPAYIAIQERRALSKAKVSIYPMSGHVD